MSETNPLENALQKGTFNVLDAAKGRSYPTDKVTLYTDFKAEYEVRKVEARIAELADKNATKAVVKERNELESKREACLEAIKASALTFHLRGIAPGVHEAIYKEADAHLADENNTEITDEDSRNKFANDAVIAAHIVKVVNAEGAEDTEWSTEKVSALHEVLPDGELIKLLAKVSELSFQAAAFDQVVGPDFS